MSKELSQLRAKSQLYFIRHLKVLKNPECTLSDVHSLIEQIAFLVNLTSSNTQLENEFNLFSIDLLKLEFKNNLYSICLKEIISTVNVDKKSERVTLQQVKTLLIKIMNVTNFSDSFNILYDLCTSLKPGHHRDFVLYLLGQYLSKHLLQKLFIENTRFSTSDAKNCLFKRQSLLEDKLIQKVVNLPDKLANLYDPRTLKNHFMPKYYFKTVATDLWLCLKFSHDKVVQSSIGFDKLANCMSIEFFNSVFGKISLLGYSDILSSSFLANLISNCCKDETGNWSRLAQYMFSSMPYKYLESCLLNIIRNSNSYEDIGQLIGDLALTNSSFQYLLFDKFLFMKTFNEKRSIQNLIGYLCDSNTRRELYYEVFKKLLNAWSTQTSIINTSYEQHFYLTKCIIVCLAFSEKKDKSILSQDLMQSLLKGVERHLHSPIENLRTLGMIVGENLMNDLNEMNKSNETPRPLKFEYTETEETRLLNSLKIRPVKLQRRVICDFDTENIDELYSSEAVKADRTEKVLFDNKNLDLKITLEDEDSDDDLVPFDTSNDVPLVKLKQPAYLRDCLHALVYSEDPEKIEISLKSVENLCNTYHYELEEICVEILKVVLHKSNAYAMADFEEIRMNAMISITVHYPKESAQYLTSQFYEPGYSLTQRTDILNVLVMSAQKLSNPNEDPIFDKRVFDHQNLSLSSLISLNAKMNTQPMTNLKPDNWREIVRRRIELKTKYKRQPGTKMTVSKQKQNVYSETYGYFFFPLLRPYDTNRVHLNILKQDFMLLGKMIFSLAVIMYSSVNTLVVENMVTALLDFIWALRNHPEPFIRKSILFALSLILIVVDDSQILANLDNYFIELKYWLEGIIVNDPNIECQKRAADCLSLLSQRVKEKFLCSNEKNYLNQMPPSSKKKLPEPSSSQRNALSSMFKKIESRDSKLKECHQCQQKIKSCLFSDHLSTKCPERVSLNTNKDTDDIIFLCTKNDNSSNNNLNLINQKRNSPCRSLSNSSQIDSQLDEKPAKFTKLEPIEPKVSIFSVKVLDESSLKNEKIEPENYYDQPVNSPIIELIPDCTVDIQQTGYDEIILDEDEDDEIKPFQNIQNTEASNQELESNESRISESVQITASDALGLLNEDSHGSSQSNKDNFLLNTFIDTNKDTVFTPKKASKPIPQYSDESDLYLNNFETVIKSVLNESTYVKLLSVEDSETIERFSKLNIKSKILYIRLFQRKFNWISIKKISYNQIAENLTTYLSELIDQSFLETEDKIESYEEIMYLLQLDQLKDLAKECNVGLGSNTIKRKKDLIKLILTHFSRQKSLTFNSKPANKSTQLSLNSNKSYFMTSCKKILGKCYKLNTKPRQVFLRLLLLYALTSSHPTANTDSGQISLLQILMVNLRDTKYVEYELNLTIEIFKDKDALTRYMIAIELESDLLSLIEAKEYDQAFEKFDNRLEEFQAKILDQEFNENDLKLPIYLRRFTPGAVYCRILSLFTDEILERFKKHKEANEIYEFLLYRQQTYLQQSRARWFLRMALNYETHLKLPQKALETLILALNDKQHVRKAGRLSLYIRLVKMSETKRYQKIKELKEGLKSALLRGHFPVKQAPIREIEGTLLHSDFIPGRKNVFIQNFEASQSTSSASQLQSTQSEGNSESDQSSKALFKNAYGLSVERVALTHYIQDLGFTNGKHGETSVMTTLFGILFWDIIFDKTVPNVFVDKYQSAPLDLQTDFFYQNRKNSIDSKLDLLKNAPIDFICQLFQESWEANRNTVSLVSWNLFANVEELLDLVKCFHTNQLASLCKNFCLNFRYFRSGGPDLVLWSTETKKCRFVEVKGPGDKLSEKQIIWLDFFMENSIECEVCYVKGKNSKRLR